MCNSCVCILGGTCSCSMCAQTCRHTSSWTCVDPQPAPADKQDWAVKGRCDRDCTAGGGSSRWRRPSAWQHLQLLEQLLLGGCLARRWQGRGCLHFCILGPTLLLLSFSLHMPRNLGGNVLCIIAWLLITTTHSFCRMSEPHCGQSHITLYHRKLNCVCAGSFLQNLPHTGDPAVMWRCRHQLGAQ